VPCPAPLQKSSSVGRPTSLRQTSILDQREPRSKPEEWSSEHQVFSSQQQWSCSKQHCSCLKKNCSCFEWHRSCLKQHWSCLKQHCSCFASEAPYLKSEITCSEWQRSQSKPGQRPLIPMGWLVILRHPLKPLKKAIAPSAKTKIKSKRVREQRATQESWGNYRQCENQCGCWYRAGCSRSDRQNGNSPDC